MLTLTLTLALILAAAAVLTATAGAHPQTSPCPGVRAGTLRCYAHRAVLIRWRSEAEWDAFDAIITPESGWDPCAVFPSRHDCGYGGTNSCGLAQRNPCPGWMRGQLWRTRFRQVWNAIAYIHGRYGTPSRALAFRRVHGWY